MRDLNYWCFKLTQPQRITSGLRKTFIKRYIVERTNKAEKDRKNSEKVESLEDFMQRNTVERAIKTETDTRAE